MKKKIKPNNTDKKTNKGVTLSEEQKRVLRPYAVMKLIETLEDMKEYSNFNDNDMIAIITKLCIDYVKKTMKMQSRDEAISYFIFLLKGLKAIHLG